MAKKPYIYEDLEWLEITRQKSWWDDDNNPDDLAPYSEFMQPYANDKGKHSYPTWEWSWPPITPWPLPGPPDPIDNDCSIDEDCVWAGINGRAELECEECYTYTQAHVWYGCEVAPWWAAYGSWELDNNTTGGKCYLLFDGPIMATVCCEPEAQGSFTISYNGPLGCSGSMAVAVTCDVCCEEFEISGSATVNDNADWVGTITPACPGAECTVESNSGCEGFSCSVNEAGSEVTVSVPDDACGGFTVTVTDGNSENPDCTATDSMGVRINNTGGDQPPGSWTQQSDCNYNTVGPAKDCNAPFNGACYKGGTTTNNNCTVELTKYISARQPCQTSLPGYGCLTACPYSECPGSCAGSPCAGEPTNTRSCQCTGSGQSGWWWNLEVQTWVCTCE